MGREASQVLSPPQLSCESSVIADAHRIRDEFFNTIGRLLPQFKFARVLLIQRALA